MSRSASFLMDSPYLHMGYRLDDTQPFNSLRTKKQKCPSVREDPSKPLRRWFAFQLMEGSGSDVSFFTIRSYYSSSSNERSPIRERFACRAVKHHKDRRYKSRVVYAFASPWCSHRGLGCIGFICPGTCGGNICCRFAGLFMSSPPEISDICLRWPAGGSCCCCCCCLACIGI